MIYPPSDPRTTLHRLRGHYRAWSPLLGAYLTREMGDASALAWLHAYHGARGLTMARMARVVDVAAWATECVACGGFACRRCRS